MKKNKMFLTLILSSVLINANASFALLNRSSNIKRLAQQTFVHIPYFFKHFSNKIEIADPTYDTPFKVITHYLFAEKKDYGVKILNELLKQDLDELKLKIKSVQILNDTIENPPNNEASTDKANKIIPFVKFDTYLRCNCIPTKDSDFHTQAFINIEMQKRRELFYIARAALYSAEIISSNSQHLNSETENKIVKTEKYGNIAATFVISFLNFNLTDYKECGPIFRTVTKTDTLYKEIFPNTLFDSKTIISTGLPHLYFVMLPKLYDCLESIMDSGVSTELKEFYKIMTLNQASKKDININENKGVITLPIDYSNSELGNNLIQQLKNTNTKKYRDAASETQKSENELNRIKAEEFKKGQEEGIKKGQQEGIIKGKQEGIKEGIIKGKQEGIKEGIKEGIIKALIGGITPETLKGIYGDDYAEFIDAELATATKTPQNEIEPSK